MPHMLSRADAVYADATLSLLAIRTCQDYFSITPLHILFAMRHYYADAIITITATISLIPPSRRHAFAAERHTAAICCYAMPLRHYDDIAMLPPPLRHALHFR